MQLDGTASTAPYGDPLSYWWTLEQKPVSSAATLSDATASRPYFFADLPGDYLVGLVVSDGLLDSDPAWARVTATKAGDAVDLSLAVSDYPDPVIRKETLEYRFVVDNQGADAASDVQLDLVVHGDVRGTPVVDGTQGCSLFHDGMLSCQLIDRLPADESIQAVLRVTPKRPGTFSVEATVSSSNPDYDPLDNTVLEETVVLR